MKRIRKIALALSFAIRTKTVNGVKMYEVNYKSNGTVGKTQEGITATFYDRTKIESDNVNGLWTESELDFIFSGETCPITQTPTTPTTPTTPITDKMKKIDEATTLLENSGFDVVERIEGCYGEEFLKIEVNEFTWDFVDGELWVSSYLSESSKFEEIKSFDLDAIAEVILEFHGLVSPTETKSVIEHVLADYDKLTFKRKAPMIDIILDIQRLERDAVPLSYDTLSRNYKVAELVELVNKRIAPHLPKEESTISLSNVASIIIENIPSLVDEDTFNYLKDRDDKILESHIVQTGVAELFEDDRISMEEVYNIFVDIWDGNYKVQTTPHQNKTTIEGFSVTPFKYQTITSEIANKLDIELRAFRDNHNVSLLSLVFEQCNVNSISELTNAQSDEVFNYLKEFGSRV